MKKISLIFVCFLGVFFAGCASVEQKNEVQRVAVFSISSNVSINWYDDGFNKDENVKKGGVLSDQLNKIVDGKNPEHFTSQERLAAADEIFRAKMDELAGITVIEKEDFLKSATYDAQNESTLSYIESRDFLDGYKRIPSLGRKKNRLIMQETGIQKMYRFDFKFEKKLAQGNRWNGQVAALAQMQVYEIDSTGKVARPKVYDVKSVSTVPIVNRKYSQQAVVDLYPELIENLIVKFVMDLM